MPSSTIVQISLSAAVLAGCLVHDIVSALHVPKYVRSVANRLSSPFQNFVTLVDLHEPIGKTFSPDLTKARALFGLAALQSAIWITHLTFLSIASGFDISSTQALVGCVSWIYASCRLLSKAPVTSPLWLVSLATVFATFALLRLLISEEYLDRESTAVYALVLTTSTIFISVASTLPVQTTLPAPNVASGKEVPSSKLSMPEDNVTLGSWFTFSFVEGIFYTAKAHTLQETDVWLLSPYFRHKNIFNKYLEYQSRHPSHSLLRFLLTSNSLDLILDILLELWSAFVGFVPPYALQQILATLADGTPESRSAAYFWSYVTFVAHLSFAQVDLFQSWHTRRCYERTRGILFCAIHYKSLKRQDISARVNTEDTEHNSADLGKIVNLMQGDAYAVSQRFWEFSGVFTSPIRLIIAMVFLYNVLGWSAMFGVVLVLVAYILNYPLAMYNIKITRASWKAKDSRMNIVNELLQNIRFLKFYGWEYQWERRSRDARETELGWRVKENIVDTGISFIWTWVPSATALVTFACYTLIAGQRLTVSKAFTAIALFSNLQGPMTALPSQFFALLHAYVSMQRIEHFLNEDEVPEWASTLTAPSSTPPKPAVGFSKATFEWQSVPKTMSMGPQFELGPLDLTFPRGRLSLISGATGSGKSALLAALLGEMHCKEGSVIMDKRFHQVAYCAQNPWLEHATIRDNVIFGSKFAFDAARYQSVIEACALKRDLEMFTAGDLTEIGEKGITLSGGQRARIALARAVYSQAKVVLLDDPLAAVDMHTSQHIVNQCLAGSLVRDRTVILVTHHITLCLPIASYLVELSHGKVVMYGDIGELRAAGQLQKAIEDEEQDEEYAEPEKKPEAAAENEADAIQKKKGLPELMPDNGNGSSGKLIEAERRAEGRVAAQTYLTYIKAAGVWCWILTLFLMVLIRVVSILAQVFLAAWGEAYPEGEARGFFSIHSFYRTSSIDPPWTKFPPPDDDVRPWLLVYLWISLVGAFSVLVYIALGYYASLQASRALFIRLLARMTRAPSRFFDTTPIGRILNRFTTDINTIDGALQESARQCLQGVLNFIASFLVILVEVPTFAPFALFIAWLYIRLAPSYIRASRDLRRLESISLSPAFAGFDELLRGIKHVRAFGMEQRYQDGFYGKVDKFQSYDHVYWLVNGWLRWRYDCLGSVVVFATTVFALWMGISHGATAIVIVQAGIFAESSRQLVKVAAQLELDFNSVERVTEYLDVPQEAPAVIDGHRPPAYWPSNTGQLEVQGLTVKYAEDLPAVLKRLSFTISPTEKIGVVGRTGSGKSTLALSMLRMIEPTEGTILIDGIDITSIGLEDLRTRITIVSQDVSLFTGTIRSNLDPLGECTTEECLDVIHRCHLATVLSHQRDVESFDLDMPVSHGSLSGGERQLVALARAILRKTNIIIMDEATSQIDSALDDQIQRTIREELSNAVVITIAHRLKTIIDYDRILVLDDGQILEFGSPRTLLSNEGGAFREMCRRSPDWPFFASFADDS